MAYTTNTSRDRRRRADLNSSNIRRLIDVTGGIVLVALIGAFTSFLLINWITGCGEQFPTASGTYVQGECVYPSDLFNNHRETQTPQESNT
jgi:hypothetical protein